MRFALGLCAVGLMICSVSVGADDTPPSWCAHIVQHQPRDDVTFKTGVDTNGQPVAPADINEWDGNDLGGGGLFPVEIPVTVDMAGRIGLDNTATKLGGEAILGVARVDANGHVAFNGRDITPQMQTLCAPSTKPAP